MYPQGITGSSCRLGGDPKFGVDNCPGPCDLRKLGIGNAEVSQLRRGIDVFEGKSPRVNFYPPNKPAAEFRRGQTVTMKYTRSNHGPGGFERYTLVPLDKNWMDKSVHTRLAIHFSCWGETPVAAKPNELERDEFGFSFIGSDGQQHSFSKGYYISKVTIPDVVPDGKYMVGWSWYGGCGCAVTGNGPLAPCRYSYFSDYWSCSFIEIKGGNPLAKEYKPAFVGSNFAEPKGSGCRAAFDSLGQCTYEPCTGKKCEFIKPKEFQGAGPRTLTPADFGYDGTLSEEKEEEKKPEPEPMPEPEKLTPMPSSKPKIEKKYESTPTPSSEQKKEDKPVETPEMKKEGELSVDDFTKPMITKAVLSCICIGKSKKCSSWFESRTYGCKGKTSSYRQPESCKKYCCTLCKAKSNWRICRRYWRVRKMCGF